MPLRGLARSAWEAEGFVGFWGLGVDLRATGRRRAGFGQACRMWMWVLRSGVGLGGSFAGLAGAGFRLRSRPICPLWVARDVSILGQRMELWFALGSVRTCCCGLLVQKPYLGLEIFDLPLCICERYV